MDDVKIVGATAAEVIERVDEALGTALQLITGIPGVVWASALPGYPATTISVYEMDGEDDEPDHLDVVVAPRPPINGQAVATAIFQAVTAGTNWDVAQWSDAFGLIAKRPPSAAPQNEVNDPATAQSIIAAERKFKEDE